MVKTLDEKYYNKWYLSPRIDWGNIGADVVNRPTENMAFNNIATESKYIQNINKWSIDFTKDELLVMKINIEVTKEDLDYKKYNKLYRVDSVIRKISKVSGYSENYVIRLLNNITKKVYLREILGYEDNIVNLVNGYDSNYNNKENKKYSYINNKRNKYYKKLRKYKKNV